MAVSDRCRVVRILRGRPAPPFLPPCLGLGQAGYEEDSMYVPSKTYHLGHNYTLEIPYPLPWTMPAVVLLLPCNAFWPFSEFRARLLPQVLRLSRASSNAAHSFSLAGPHHFILRLKPIPSAAHSTMHYKCLQCPNLNTNGPPKHGCFAPLTPPYAPPT